MSHFYLVRPGKSFRLNDKHYTGGDLIELWDPMPTSELSNVEPCDAKGVVDRPPTPLETELARVQPHSRITLLEQERVRLKTEMNAIDAAIKVEQDAEATAKQTLKDAPVARPTTDDASPGAHASVEGRLPERSDSATKLRPTTPVTKSDV